MKVLVTGGSGFIGRQVVRSCEDAGLSVRVLDLASGGDIRDASTVAAALDGVDAVCHQAARVGLGVDFGDVADYVSHNDVGTATLLRALWQISFTGRVVLASSMVVYGEGLSRCEAHGLVTPPPRSLADLSAGRFGPRCPVCASTVSVTDVSENAPASPRNVYAATKLHQEHLCFAWGRESGATVVALRYHNVYGPGMPRNTPYAGVAALFRSALREGLAPRVFEDGGQTRDFVHVADVARANVLALCSADVPAGVYNIASGTPHTVLDMADALCAGGAISPVVTGEFRLGDVRHIVASPAKAAAVLGFEARVGFEDGMRSFGRS